MLSVSQIFQLIGSLFGVTGAFCLYSVFFRQTAQQIYDSLSGNQSFAYGRIEAENFVKQNATNQVGWICFIIAFIAQVTSIFSSETKSFFFCDVFLIMFLLFWVAMFTIYRLYRWIYLSKVAAVHKLGILDVFGRYFKGQIDEKRAKELTSWPIEALNIGRLQGENDEEYLRRTAKEIGFEVPSDVVFLAAEQKQQS